MNRWRLFIKLFILLMAAVLLGMAALPSVAQGPTPAGEAPTPTPLPPPADQYMPGRILVKFRPAVGQLNVQRSLAGRDLRVADTIPAIGVLKVAVEPGRELEAVAALQSDPNVLYAEPDYIVHAITTVPNDTSYGSQWGLPKIDAPKAWDITTGNSSVVIAVIDTGIDLEHPDFACADKLTAGKNFVNPSLPPDDDNGHGTHVAGIAAACTNNNSGVAGVAWKARLMPVKALGANGSGFYSDVVSGMSYAVDHGAQIINLSLAGPDSSAMADAVQNAYQEGVLVVAAAGNFAHQGNPIMYPAAYSAALAVAATDQTDAWAYFSEHHPYVDVAAPGVRIYSTYNSGVYANLDGTSMSTPYVSGLAALIWSINPGYTPDQVRNVIQSTADDLGDPGKDNYFGYGRINAWRALSSLVALQSAPNQANFLIDDDSGPFPSSIPVQITTNSSGTINWSAVESPPTGWLHINPPSSGTVSAASASSLSLTVSRPSSHGTYTANVAVTGSTPSGGSFGPAIVQVRITYLPDLYEYRFPILRKNGP